MAGWILVHFVWQGTLIGALTLLLLRALRHRSPQARYAVACAALVAMAAAPLATAAVLSRTADLVSTPDVSVQESIEQSLMTLSARIATAEEAMKAGGEPPPADDVASSLSSPGWFPAIVALWMTGVAILLARLVGGWWRVSRLHRAVRASAPSRWRSVTERIAGSLGITRAIAVVDSSLVDTPTLIGWITPVIVLPIAALAGLSTTQVEAILAHELAHIRRHDFIVNLLQTFTETMLFYHPAVWWVSGRIRVEREHCCDLVAMSVCGDPVSYAEALVELARRQIGDTPLVMAATASPLLARVRRLLGVPLDETPTRFTTTSVAAVAAVIVLVIGAARFGAAQPEVDRAPANEVRVPSSGDPAAWHMLFDQNDSQMRFVGFKGRDLIRFAYQVPSTRVIGGPRWIDEEILRIIVTLDAAPRADEMPALVQKVLEERLHLKTHLESRDFPVLALVRAGVAGPNMRPSTTDCFDMQEWIDAGQPPPVLPPRLHERGKPRQPVCGEESWEGRITATSYVAITMPQFAEELRGVARAWPTSSDAVVTDVIDRTGLTGRYDLKLEGFRLPLGVTSRILELAKALEPLGLMTWPRILEEQLGLTLEEAQAPYDVIVIDHIERPAN
jgi:uncharacterized protein (TIGR03435 family)